MRELVVSRQPSSSPLKGENPCARADFSGVLVCVFGFGHCRHPPSRSGRKRTMPSDTGAR